MSNLCSNVSPRQCHVTVVMQFTYLTVFKATFDGGVAHIFYRDVSKPRRVGYFHPGIFASGGREEQVLT